MNNLTFGSRPSTTASQRASNPIPALRLNDIPPFAYYETIGGGAGAGPTTPGASGIHVHMSNTRNTPVEALEYTFPIRVTRYALRQDSGGQGLFHGGEGLIREIRFMAPATGTIVSERRVQSPYGLNGGRPGAPGRNTLIRQGASSPLPGKVTLDLEPGDVIRIETPGGGGWG